MRSGEHVLWDVAMRTGRARARVAYIGRVLAAIGVGFADACRTMARNLAAVQTAPAPRRRATANGIGGEGVPDRIRRHYRDAPEIEPGQNGAA